MRSIIKNKKGFAPLFTILFVFLALIVIYLLLFIPFPAFTKIRMIINYFMIIILWVIIQAGLLYAYFKLGSFAVSGFNILKGKFVKVSLNLKKFLIIHS
jgi:hypothetical protein